MSDDHVRLKLKAPTPDVKRRNHEGDDEEIRRETNTEFLARIMEFAKTGPLMQGFIMDALTKQSNAVVSLGIEELTKKMRDNGLVHPQAWFNCAKELKDELDKRHGS